MRILSGLRGVLLLAIVLDVAGTVPWAAKWKCAGGGFVAHGGGVDVRTGEILTAWQLAQEGVPLPTWGLGFAAALMVLLAVEAGLSRRSRWWSFAAALASAPLEAFMAYAAVISFAFTCFISAGPGYEAMWGVDAFLYLWAAATLLSLIAAAARAVRRTA